jgi:hypothetical protein
MSSSCIVRWFSRAGDQPRSRSGDSREISRELSRELSEISRGLAVGVERADVGASVNEHVGARDRAARRGPVNREAVTVDVTTVAGSGRRRRHATVDRDGVRAKHGLELARLVPHVRMRS